MGVCSNVRSSTLDQSDGSSPCPLSSECHSWTAYLKICQEEAAMPDLTSPTVRTLEKEDLVMNSIIQCFPLSLT